jgi:predicted HicB family RNase H-like nuclease
LRALKTEGAIDDYRTRTVRTGKYHYRIDIRLVLTAEQAKIILNDLVTKILRMSRWDNGH